MCINAPQAIKTFLHTSFKLLQLFQFSIHFKHIVINNIFMDRCWYRVEVAWAYNGRGYNEDNFVLYVGLGSLQNYNLH